jgi:hypothetical protein
MIVKIISGGQTGADKGALLGACDLGFPTGGYAPRLFRTDEGNNSGLKEFGLVATNSGGYPLRTLFNVLDSQATAIFGNLNSPGVKLTIRYCKKYGRPYLTNPSALELREFVVSRGILVLNIAGNRERTNPGIENKVRYLIVAAFQD